MPDVAPVKHHEQLDSVGTMNAELRIIALNTYMVTRKISEAEKIIQLISDMDEETPETKLKYSSILGLKADYKGAIEILLSLNKEFPGKPAILKRLALGYEQQRQPKRALAFLKAYNKISPDEDWVKEKMRVFSYVGAL